MAARRISIAALVDQPTNQPGHSPTGGIAPPTPNIVESNQYLSSQKSAPTPQSIQPQTLSWALNKPSTSARPSSSSADLTFTAYRVPAPPSHSFPPSQAQEITPIHQNVGTEYENHYPPSHISSYPTNTPISFEFYDPSEPKKSSSKKRGSTSTQGTKAAKSTTNMSGHRRAASSNKSRDLDSHTSGELSAIGNATLSPDTTVSGGGVRKTSGDTDAVMATTEDLNRVSLGGLVLHSQKTAETTVEDDIMADLDMAEESGRTGAFEPMASSQRGRSSTREVDSEMDLDLEILGESTGSGNTLLVPAVPKRLGTPSSAATGSPAPSSLLAVPTVNRPAKKATTAKSAAPKAKPKVTTTKPPAKKKAETTKKVEPAKGKQKSDADWTWGTSSGRAAAAAATNALLTGGGYDEGLDFRKGTDTPPVGKNWEPEAADEEGEDDEDKRLYCICRELYDNRFMVGCDNCDEWYHPPCLGMQDFECDLLEHFYCDSCRKADPSLCTTWRTRCANGLQHPYPDSGEACWRAALPPLSKYCSKECGVQAMERKIAPYVTAKARTTYDPGQPIPLTPVVITEMNKLYDSVKHLKRRQAVVVQVHASSSPSATPSLEAARLSYSYEKLTGTLLELDQQVRILSRELGFILARGRLAELAVQWSEKSENLSRCGFDSRLLIEGPQWEEWVEGEGKTTLEADMFGDIPIFKRTTPQQFLGDGTLAGEKAGADGAITPGEEEEGDVADSPWCDGRRKCERHFGWQKLCYSEYELNKGTKELAIHRLQHRQQDVQARMENIQQLLQTLHAANQSAPVSAS